MLLPGSTLQPNDQSEQPNDQSEHLERESVGGLRAESVMEFSANLGKLLSYLDWHSVKLPFYYR